jgi:ribonuclease R
MIIGDITQLQERAQHLSYTERRADLATRDAVDWLKCEFMLDKVGETFSGKISSVNGFGFFVLLDDFFVEGLVHISDLRSDYYHFDERRRELKGEQSQRVFQLADEIVIQVSRVDLDDKKIEFVLPENAAEDNSARSNKVAKKQYGNKKTVNKRSENRKNVDRKASGDKSKGKKYNKKKKPASQDNKKASGSENFTVSPSQPKKKKPKKPEGKPSEGKASDKKKRKKKKSNAKSSF